MRDLKSTVVLLKLQRMGEYIKEHEQILLRWRSLVYTVNPL